MHEYECDFGNYTSGDITSPKDSVNLSHKDINDSPVIKAGWLCMLKCKCLQEIVFR